MPTRSRPRTPARDDAGPRRTCVVTREEHPQRELLRVALLPDDTVVVDRSGKLPGRGAWVKPERAVIEQLEKKPGILGRALKVENPGAITAVGLLDQARAVTHAALLDMLSLCARSGCLASGADQVAATVRAGDALALIAAADASEASVATARGAREDLDVFRIALDREALGHRIGKGPRAVVAIRAGGPARPLIQQLRRGEGLR